MMHSSSAPWYRSKRSAADVGTIANDIQILSVVLTLTICMQVKHGMGRHLSTLTDTDKYYSQIWLWASVWVYYLALSSVKCSILIQYLRIFPRRESRIACYVMIGVVAAYTCWTFFSAIFACTPVAAFWDETISGHCLDKAAVW